MDSNFKSVNMALTQQAKRMDELYHRYSVYTGLSDPAMWILYTLCEDENAVYTQNDLVGMWFYPKQTINYAVGSLVNCGWLQLEQLPGGRNRKALRLTAAGQQFCSEKILPLIQAEEKSIARMTEEEQLTLLKLNQKQLSNFEEEIQKIIGETKEKSL